MNKNYNMTLMNTQAVMIYILRAVIVDILHNSMVDDSAIILLLIRI